MTGYHGTSRNDWVLHVGLCLVEDSDVAENYAAEWATGSRPARVVEVELDLTGLNVVEAEAGDRDSATWAGDSAASIAAYVAAGADVLVYEDEDYRGRSHETYRLVSERAVTAAKVVAVEVLGDDDED
jgi:hypothetical protein